MPIQLSGSGSITGVSTLTSLASLDVTGSVSVGGTLIYDDVTNIDSLGIVTARSDVHVGAGLSVSGISTFNDYLDINGSINIDASRFTYDASTNQLKLADDVQLRFGDGNDLRIYHSGTDGNSYIEDAGPGGLKLTGSDIYLRNVSDHDMIHAQSGGYVKLYHNNNQRLETTNLGINVTGTVTASGTGGGAAALGSHLDLGDNQKVRLGANDDLDMYHDGTDSYIRNSTGQLLIRGDDIKLNNYLGTKTHAEFADGGLTTGAIDLSAISSSISDTATDIFIYDTRKDSDGGAWRKRTQHTSWYNETLNTGTRGSRREFPSVAVIVAERNFIRIYDGDDPDLPMWMVFNTIANGVSQGMADRPMIQVMNTDKVVYALNGILATGTKNEGSNYGQPIINFISEKVLRMDSEGGEGGEWMGTIAQRNEAIGYRSVDYDYVIATSRVNDIAMTVLPNAPIDDATGLPVPTIAVATNGGVSIIKDDGNVFDSSDTDAFGSIDFTFHDGIRLVNTRTNTGSSSQRYFISVKIDTISADGWNLYDYYTGNFAAGYPRLRSEDTGAGVVSRNGDNGTVLGSNVGLALWDVKYTDISSSGNYFTNSLMCFTSSSFNTGWMHGDIKGAFLSDTDTTNVNADTLNAVNAFDGTFASSTGWTANSDWSISGGVATCNGNNSGRFIYPTNDRWSYGRSVVVEVTVTAYTSGTLSISYATGGATSGTNMTATGTYKFVNVTTGNDLIYIRSDSFVGSIDGVKIYYAEYDRSVSNKGLIPYGTITKSAVATGAELVSYSGWSSSNYLIQPYNSDLDFGTGDWSYMFWYNPNDAESGDVIFSRWSYNVDNVVASRVSAYFNNGNLRVDTADASAGTAYQGHFGSDGTQDSNEWHCAVILRRGPNLEIWIDGKNYRTGSLNSNSDASYTNTNAILEIGHSPGNGAPEAGLELALFRISGTAPSAEQIKKIYEDEKFLFQENAKATLYGSSDDVTALAYDDSNNVLHVGTSSGRSEFQGLRRINNTTTAVTTAISASNGLVAEQ